MAKRKTREFFVWTDDEVELLLKITHEYKAVKAAENMNWESCQSKYSDIFEQYRERYPLPEEAMEMGKEYPHKKYEITKGQLTTKLKAIRIRYRQAVDSGRKRGHGRVVLLYFDLCESIWGESPATDLIPQSIETGDMAVEALELIATSPDTGSSSMLGGDGVAEGAVSAEMVVNRRQSLNTTLNGYRREKLKRKLSMDSIAQEDLDIKRRLLQRLQATDDKFVQTMGRWSSTMERLNSNIELLVQHIMGSGRCVDNCGCSCKHNMVSKDLSEEYENLEKTPEKTLEDSKPPRIKEEPMRDIFPVSEEPEVDLASGDQALPTGVLEAHGEKLPADLETDNSPHASGGGRANSSSLWPQVKIETKEEEEGQGASSHHHHDHGILEDGVIEEGGPMSTMSESGGTVVQSPGDAVSDSSDTSHSPDSQIGTSPVFNQRPKKRVKTM
ncbi:uncharacterized protein LOC130126700 [Lampris incognitus]|uniref:uncharacterized protein LOC130126700 n=1 Tax=Lampris incognitus TaxID=2546036 RepID=UPI0024B57B08|nr:uncharacterized protein LOC130126700 [Lampris incognitus]